jgi:hypothetical protein
MDAVLALSGFRRPFDRLELGRIARADGPRPGDCALSVLLLPRLERGGIGGGWFFARWAWPGVAGLLGALVGAALLVAVRLSKVPPPRHLQVL